MFEKCVFFLGAFFVFLEKVVFLFQEVFFLQVFFVMGGNCFLTVCGCFELVVAFVFSRWCFFFLLVVLFFSKKTKYVVVFFICGCFVFLKKAVFLQVGVFSEWFFEGNKKEVVVFDWWLFSQ